MKALVAYDSAYGNTEKVAQAIGDALGTQGNVEVVRVGDVQPAQLAELTLLIVGSPTQKFSPTGATNRFLKSIPRNSLQGVRVAAFDTRFPPSDIDKVRILAFFVRIFGYAAKPIADKLVKKGGSQAIAPEGFYVSGTEGPLVEGELERAASWARQLMTAQ